MKYLLSAVAFANLASVCASAEMRLAPCAQGFPDEYEHRVESIAQAAMPRPPELWVTVIPSFSPEWSIAVSTAGGIHRLTYVEFDQSLWYSSMVRTGANQMTNDPSKGKASGKAKTATISPALYDALRSEWGSSVNATRKTENIGLDGETYYFRLPHKCATTWSPEASTRGGKLVALVRALKDMALTQSRSADSIDEAKAMKIIRDLPKLID